MYKEKSRRRKHLLLLASLMLLLSTLACADMFTEMLADEIEDDCLSKGMKYEDGVCVPIPPDEENDSISVDTRDVEEDVVNADQGEAISGEVYIGEIKLPALLTDDLKVIIDTNEVIITVGEDGRVSGGQKLIFNYTRVGVDDAFVYLYEDYITTLEGVLTDGRGQLTGTITHHFVSSGPGAADPQDRIVTFEVTYDVHISGDIMSAQVTSEEIESEKDIYSFEAKKQ